MQSRFATVANGATRRYPHLIGNCPGAHCKSQRKHALTGSPSYDRECKPAIVRYCRPIQTLPERVVCDMRRRTLLVADFEGTREASRCAKNICSFLKDT